MHNFRVDVVAAGAPAWVVDNSMTPVTGRRYEALGE